MNIPSLKYELAKYCKLQKIPIRIKVNGKNMPRIGLIKELNSKGFWLQENDIERSYNLFEDCKTLEMEM